MKNETLIFGAALTVVSCWAGDVLPDHRYLTLDARQAKIVLANPSAAADPTARTCPERLLESVTTRAYAVSGGDVTLWKSMREITVSFSSTAKGGACTNVPLVVVTAGEGVAVIGLPEGLVSAIEAAVVSNSPYARTVFVGLSDAMPGNWSFERFARGADRRIVSVVLEELSKGAVPFESKRRTLLARPRTVIWNTDGCDMVYYPENLPVDEPSFWSKRLAYVRGTTADTISYCPLSSGFGAFTAAKAGEFMTNGLSKVGTYNAARRFRDECGTDALEMATRFARRHGYEVFVSLRMNDTHDASPRSKRFFPRWKAEHPECLMSESRGPRSKGYCKWTAVDYGKETVREYLKSFVLQFVENYDLDGIEYDFNRHSQFFLSTFEGRDASAAERETMTQLLRELKAITEDAGRRRGRPILVTARTNDAEDRTLTEGLDVDAWMKEGLIDAWIVTGYFQQRPWSEAVARARRYGCRIYASMDESRTEETAKRRGLACLSGRSRYLPNGGCGAFYAARISAAMAAGVDGLWLFNLEGYSGLNTVGQIWPQETEGLQKRYYATERDPYNADYLMKDGRRFDTMPDIFPLKPHKMAAGGRYEFNIFVGDDFAAASKRGLVPMAKVEVLTGGKPVTVTMNGQPLTLTPTGGASAYVADVPADLLRRGDNAFAIGTPEATTLNDFLLTIEYVRK